jgi:hypothetical protein
VGPFILGCIAALFVVVAGNVRAQERGEPPPQVAFRVALTEYSEKAAGLVDPAQADELVRLRAMALLEVLGGGLQFIDWVLELKGIESTPRGKYFVRFVDPMLARQQLPRVTYWNTGPGQIGRQAEVAVGSSLHQMLGLMKPGSLALISGSFFPDADGAPAFESARIHSRKIDVEKAKLRMPYFSVRLASIRLL